MNNNALYYGEVLCIVLFIQSNSIPPLLISVVRLVFGHLLYHQLLNQPKDEHILIIITKFIYNNYKTIAIIT